MGSRSDWREREPRTERERKLRRAYGPGWWFIASLSWRWYLRTLLLFFVAMGVLIALDASALLATVVLTALVMVATFVHMFRWYGASGPSDSDPSD